MLYQLSYAGSGQSERLNIQDWFSDRQANLLRHLARKVILREERIPHYRRCRAIRSIISPLEAPALTVFALKVLVGFSHICDLARFAIIVNPLALTRTHRNHS